MVNINGTLSTSEYITSGLPQGTATISSTFQCTHKHDITSLTLNGKIVCYADDTALIVTGDTREQVFPQNPKLYKIYTFLATKI